MNDNFDKVFPEHFKDLMNVIPFPDYTAYDGVYNLVNRLPNIFNRPDMGPKLYTSYGTTINGIANGMTNLHLDMSDAVNVMIYADGQTADGKPKACAIWHIFPPEDAQKIRKFFQHFKPKQYGEKCSDDPIHDEIWYLDRNLRDLLEGYGVKCFTIEQYVGDAIFIPAGAPHQVLNVVDSIKIATDFVSPENLSTCVNLSKEFRKLSRTTRTNYRLKTSHTMQ